MKEQPFLGILMLDTQFPRIIGDAGNINSFSYPARTKVIAGAGSLDIVKDGLPSEDLIENFCAAAIALETDGAKAIISTCGFLITVQELISKTVNIPVMVSALSLYSQITKQYDGEAVAIITASQENLGDLALNSANIKKNNVLITGMEDCKAFSEAFLKHKDQQALTIDENLIEKAVVAKAQRLLSSNPNICSYLLECGNLAPYAEAIARATHKPVYSILDGANQMMKSSI